MEKYQQDAGVLKKMREKDFFEVFNPLFNVTGQYDVYIAGARFGDNELLTEWRNGIVTGFPGDRHHCPVSEGSSVESRSLPWNRGP